MTKERHGRRWTPEYTSWLSMKQRCNNPKNTGWKWYGALGVKVCDRWNTSFTNFLADMGEKPEPKTEYSIDRFPNPVGDYEPTNCRWATAEQQTINRKPYIRPNTNKTHCIHGHAFTQENTRVYRDGKSRACRQCNKNYQKQYKQSHKGVT